MRSLLACCSIALAVAGLSLEALAVDAAPSVKLVNLRTDRFPFEPPATAEAWAARSAEVRRQVLVAAGLWPMPPRPVPKATFHKHIEGDGYTLDAVSLESYPGHFVTGSLYRPIGPAKERRPAVLSPHGHWNAGRFHRWGDDELAKQLASGAERFERGGRCPLQARCVHLARSGCVVFLYDMLGYADSRQVSLEAIHAPSAKTVLDGPDEWGFYSARAELRQQNPLGVQLYNSLCALDWLESLDDVDPQRIGVTGGSSGATQTLMLCAVDPRPAVAYPVVMVSTAMQGGCGCENACGLRRGTSNVEIAALRAPAPVGMASADDWTRDFAKDGYPEMQRLYAMLGAADRVSHASLIQHPHNYNHASRAAMYAWVGKWLGVEVGEERDFEPLEPEAIRIVPATPDSAVDRAHEAGLMRSIDEQSQQLIQGLLPEDTRSLKRYREVVGGAFETLAKIDKPKSQLTLIGPGAKPSTGLSGAPVRLNDSLRGVMYKPAGIRLASVLWVAPAGSKGILGPDGKPQPAAQTLLDAGAYVLAVDLWGQRDDLLDGVPAGEAPTVPDKDNRPIASLTYGYNPTVVARRAQNILTALAALPSDQPVGMVGTAGTAPYATLAAALAGERLDATAIDTAGFRFDRVTNWRSVDFFPGAVKYGDIPALLALAAPRPTTLLGESESTPLDAASLAYRAAGAESALKRLPAEASLDDAIDDLLRTLVP